MTDKQEFERIFRQYYGGMFRLARKMLGDDQESKDVVSDVCAQLLNSHTDLHSDTLQSYLLTSIRNRCINLQWYCGCHRMRMGIYRRSFGRCGFGSSNL